MKNNSYIRCPKCELNFILKSDQMCSICKAEMSLEKDVDLDLIDDFDAEVCSICKTNLIDEDEIICEACAKGTNEEGYDEDEWEAYTNPDEDDDIVDEDDDDDLTVIDLDDEEDDEFDNEFDEFDDELDDDLDLDLDFDDQDFDDEDGEDEDDEYFDEDDDDF